MTDVSHLGTEDCSHDVWTSVNSKMELLSRESTLSTSRRDLLNLKGLEVFRSFNDVKRFIVERGVSIPKTVI